MQNSGGLPSHQTRGRRQHTRSTGCLGQDSSGLSCYAGGMNQVMHQLSGFHVSAGGHHSASASSSQSELRCKISVASYNILAQCLLHEHPELYVGCNPQHLSWSYRRRLIFQQLDALQPDVICLQEVQRDHYHSCLLPHLRQNGYEGHFKQRTGDKLDGCATFFKQDKFVCVNSVPVEYFVAGSSVLNRDNVALLLVLAPVDSLSRLVVANTHILYNPGRGDVKLAQLMFLLAAVEEMSAQSFDPSPAHHPVILCGDFNVTPDSDLYQFLTTGSLAYRDCRCGWLSGQEKRGGRPMPDLLLDPEVGVTDDCQFANLVQHRYQHVGQHFPRLKFGSGVVSHGFRFSPAYRPGPRLFTTWHNSRGFGDTTDYMLFSAGDVPRTGDGQVGRRRREGQLKLVDVLQLPTAHSVQLAGGMPSASQPSDHLLLMANFLLSS